MKGFEYITIDKTYNILSISFMDDILLIANIKEQLQDLVSIVDR